MTENEFLHQMVKAAGGDVNKLKDKLKSTYYECLIDCMKNGGGAGGGVSSWNDLTDRPFYKEYVEIVPETEVTFAPVEEMGGMNMAFLPEITEAFKYDTRYKVIYNGVEYIDATMLEKKDGIGNIGAIEGGEDNGRPYYIAAMGEEGGGMIVVPIRGDTTAKIAIYEEVITPIDYCYNKTPPILDLSETGLIMNKGMTVTKFPIDIDVRREFIKNVKKSGVALIKFLYQATGQMSVQTCTNYAFATKLGSEESPEVELLMNFTDATFPIIIRVDLVVDEVTMRYWSLV